ncbi:uncharacterized protein LOC105701371 isoform X2 [Orussus abietinus]|uniref:uncharacterized protein LOC105701371 isoform X2 n=1 Tax=Orussus abietinus TaxID=222816 RepID=UPI0006266305|nr:uncharacterized protein LOC105701371 isoform X2 [Orussus abietinus]
MPASNINVRQQLNLVMKRFKFEELESAVVPSFPEISWNQIRAKLIKLHDKFTVSDAVRVIEQTIEEAKIGNQELKNRLSMLEVIDVSRHYKKKTWYTYKLKDPVNAQNFPTNCEFRDTIMQRFYTSQMDMDVQVVAHGGVIYISIKEKTRSKQARRILPTFFALFRGQQYFFCSRKRITKAYVMVLTDSIGYKSSKRINLMGRDLKSLIKILRAKKQGITDGECTLQPPTFSKTGPISKHTGIDFTQHKQRKEYIEKCFGKDAPTIELLVMNAPDQHILHNKVPNNMENEKVHTRWEFRSRDIIAQIKKLAQDKVLQTPLPYYVSSLMSAGKNELTLRDS